MNCEIYFCLAEARHVKWNSMIGCFMVVRNKKSWAVWWAGSTGAFYSVWLCNPLWILPRSFGFPPSFPDQKAEGQLLPVIRKLSESQHGLEAGWGWWGTVPFLANGLPTGAVLRLPRTSSSSEEAPKRNTQKMYNIFDNYFSWGLVKQISEKEWSSFGSN